MAGLVMDAAALEGFLAEIFPQIAEDFAVEVLEPERLVVRLKVAYRHLRPGGTVSGPSIFALVDVGVYLATLARIGPVGLAVTTNSSLDFLRKPVGDRDLLAEVRMLKLGRSLAMADALVFSEGDAAPVARGSMTYAIPPKR
ncbi:MAG: PaaI family thioesterase [Defluviimonas sp.]|nr:PaaI family thioesterase [Defluviimonas sp.]